MNSDRHCVPIVKIRLRVDTGLHLKGKQYMRYPLSMEHEKSQDNRGAMPGEHRIHFLGICERAAFRESALDLIGLTNTYVSSFFPLQFSEFYVVYGLGYDLVEGGAHLDLNIEFVDSAQPNNPCSTHLEIAPATEEDTSPVIAGKPVAKNGEPKTFRLPYFPLADSESYGSLFAVAMPAPGLMLPKPTLLRVQLTSKGETRNIGGIRFIFRAPPPLSEAERRAIAARPTSAKLVEMRFDCRKCGDRVHFYSLLDPNRTAPPAIAKRGLRLSEAPDQWTCKCGKAVIPLVYAKHGIHEIFRTSSITGTEEVGLLPLYNAREILQIAEEYNTLIQTLPEEPIVQEYLEKHPLFWHFLAPVQILHKPDILGMYKADFGILTAGKELVLVEIERPSTKLVTEGGRISAGIQRGADQIRDWAVTIADHRNAVLKRLCLDDNAVYNIRYLLVGGLSTAVSSEGLVKLRREQLVPNTDFLCFDELASSLHALTVGLKEL